MLQEENEEVLAPGTNRAADAWLDIHARSFSERRGSPFLDVRACYPNAEASQQSKSTVSMKLGEKKRMYASRVLDVELLVFTTTGGMVDECKSYHSRLPEIIVTTMAWIRAIFS